jgi:hypothetical protein
MYNPVSVVGVGCGVPEQRGRFFTGHVHPLVRIYCSYLRANLPDDSRSNDVCDCSTVTATLWFTFSP